MESPKPARPVIFDVNSVDLKPLEGIIKSLAIDFCKRFDYASFDDLVQEGWKLYYTWAPCYYDATKSKLTTWLYMSLKQQYISILSREYGKLSKLESIQSAVDDEGADRDFEDNTSDPIAECEHSELIEQLRELASPLAVKLLNLVIDGTATKLTTRLAPVLGVSDRDIVYLRDELQQLTHYLQVR